MPKLLVRIVFILLALVTLRAAYSVIPYARDTLALQNGGDFRGYYVAATLVRARQNLENYSEATRDVDPVTENADPNTVFAQTSKRIYGTSDIQIYDYPPTIADLVEPLTYLGPARALLVWNLLNLSALVFAVHLLSGLLKIYSLGLRILLFVTALLFRATIDCIFWGQLPIFLLLLLTAGFVFYKRQRSWSAAFLFALAVAIKLTPLIVIVPLLAWRDWKTLRAIAAWGAVILGLLVLVNGWGPLHLFFLDEVPKMSGKFLHVGNEGLGNALQVLFHGTQMAPTRPIFIWASRSISAVVLGFAYWLSRSSPVGKPTWELKTEVFAIFLLLSCCLSPVSWLNAYVLSIPLLAIVGIRLWRGQSTLLELGLFSLLMISLSIAVITDLRMMTPLAGIALGLVRLYYLQREKNRTDMRDAVLSHAH
jgi:hypothetical protein